MSGDKWFRRSPLPFAPSFPFFVPFVFFVVTPPPFAPSPFICVHLWLIRLSPSPFFVPFVFFVVFRPGSSPMLT